MSAVDIWTSICDEEIMDDSLAYLLLFDFQEEALRQKRLAAAATSRPEVASSVSSMSSSDAMTVATVSPDQVNP